jgi:phosphoglycerol transferase MdoB-like AlkP superfamily enzyme
VHDEYVLDRQVAELSKSREPFFSVTMTLSNHEPFDVPGVKRINGNSEPDRFRNSAAYTDACLSVFFAKAKMQQWYRNTLFILVADHGHSLPLNRSIYYPESHHIPLLFYGDVIRPEFRGAVVTTLGNHHDIPATLFFQFDKNKAKQFVWSKNLLNPTVRPFAYYQIDHLLGWIDQKYWFGYSYNRKKFVARSYVVPHDHLGKMTIEGQSFEQVLYKNYLAY